MAIDYTGAEASAFISEIWEKKAQDAFLAGLIVTKPEVVTLAMTDKNQGDIVHIATMPALSASSITVATGALTISDTTITDTSVTLNQWRGVSVTVTDQVQDIAYLDVSSKYSESFGSVLGGDLDNYVLALQSDITNSVGNTTSPERISLDMLLAASLLLDNADVPQTNRHWILSPVGRLHILLDSNFSEVQKSGLSKLILSGLVVFPTLLVMSD